ncbi:MAG: patatin-like phospholipase family protein [Bacteroidota bacterium]
MTDSIQLGIALSGGGARGAYEVGVWKAIIELGLSKHISAIAGTY